MLSHPAVRRWSIAFRKIGRHRLRNSEFALIALCAPLGAMVGIVVLLLHHTVNWLHDVDFGLPAGTPLSLGGGISTPRLILVPMIGGALLGVQLIISRLWRPAEIIDPVEANALQGGRLSLTDSIRLAFHTLISNGAGASVGMEAAYTQVGAGMLSRFGQILRLRRSDLRVFVAAGAAAAIAAAFNAPLAGAFYAFELVLGSYTPAALAQVGIAALTGTLVAGIGSTEPMIQIHGVPMIASRAEYGLFALIGVGAAGVGIATMQATTWCETTLRRLPTPDWLRPAIGGMLLSAVAMIFPQVLGSGHGAIQMLFDHTPGGLLLLALLLAKLAASALSIGAGFRGGLFSSSLLLGCLYGGAVGQGLGWLLPSLADQRAMIMLVGTGAVAAAIVGAPVTMVMLMLEATGELRVALAVLCGVVMASTITQNIFGFCFSTWRFHQRGKAIRSAHDVGWVATLTVARLMDIGMVMARQDMPLVSLRELVPSGSRAPIFAVAENGLYVGMIDPAMLYDPDLDAALPGLIAADLAAGRLEFLLPGQDIRAALATFETTANEQLPVLAGPEDRRVVGYVSEAFALKRYAQELERHRNAELGQRDLFAVAPIKARQ